MRQCSSMGGLQIRPQSTILGDYGRWLLSLMCWRCQKTTVLYALSFDPSWLHVVLCVCGCGSRHPRNRTQQLTPHAYLYTRTFVVGAVASEVSVLCIIHGCRSFSHVYLLSFGCRYACIITGLYTFSGTKSM
ncbi:unnamed protein product [Periconia digitata]|uniref:Uncharacterized protein n=1 Tax=Periconia digitata TaxID=1303443 RepID=A0A9W4XDH2_9PLEO|nr:unnamed protein product [Periconia digitata]